MAQLTEEQLRALLEMGDIGGAEDVLKQQMDLSNQLREKVTGIQRGGVGGNIGRAGYGIASAVTDYRNKNRPAEISAMKQKLLAALLKSRPSVEPVQLSGPGME